MATNVGGRSNAREADCRLYVEGPREHHADRGKSWDEAQRDLEREWDNYQLRGKLAWHEIKDAVRDAWNRATGNR